MLQLPHIWRGDGTAVGLKSYAGFIEKKALEELLQ